MLIHFLSPGQFGDNVEFADDQQTSIDPVSPGGGSAKCDSSSRCGASGKSSGSSKSGRIG